ncbi:MAG TPA: FCD domain-containing protein [Gammaproteobacteria bacterium]
MRRLLQPMVSASAMPAQAEILDVSYPQLRAALEARAVLEAGAVWLRLSRGTISQSTSAALYERLRLMLAQVRNGREFIDRAAFFAANDSFHASVVALAENEHLSLGFKRLRLRDLFLSAMKDTPVAAENLVYFHEFLTDSIAAGDASHAVKAILSWGKQSSTSVRLTLAPQGDASSQSALRPAEIVEDLSLAVAKEQDSLAGDIDALVLALDARAALEIGITQSLGTALSVEAERDTLVARLRAFTPLVRGTSASHVLRYIRADDAFHRVFLSLLRNQHLFDIYNAMDLPELMRRVIAVAPISIREVFDDHKGLTNALKSGDADATSAAITEAANRVRAALAAFLAAANKA